MNRYLIVADDFTGANDTGVQLKRRGIPTSVVFSSEHILSKDSYVLDTESRAMEPGAAGEAVKSGLLGVVLSDFERVMKKVDSTLRGSIAAEIKALDDCYQSELVVFAPALPDLGRTTVDGVHCLKGVPITQTELSRDPKTPVREDNIARLLQAAYEEPVTHIPLASVSNGTIDFSQGRIFACDAATNGDLERIVGSALDTGKRVLWVGTAALADHLLGAEVRTPPAMAVVASVSSVSREQVHYAAGEGAELVLVPIPQMLDGDCSQDLCIQAALAHIRAGRDVLLCSSASYDREELERSLQAGQRRGMDPGQVSAYTQRVMGELTRSILEGGELSGLFITGGDTALGVFQVAESLGSSIVTEISIGIPMMRLTGGPFAGLKVVTKAGAFGGKEAITFALRKLKEVIPST